MLSRTYSFQGKSFFPVSLLWGFRLDSGEPVPEYKLWTTIADALGKSEIFDAGMPKVKGEVLVHGSFFAPDGKKVRHGNVSLLMGSVYKVLFVNGDRQWRKTLGFAPHMEGPELFSEMPVAYKNAFGGEGYDKNPSGKGFVLVETENGKIHPFPNIEYPNQLIDYPGDRSEPASFSRLDMMWKQRFSKAGTYDKKYIKERMPDLPDDIDWTYFNDAAPDQWIEGYFRGDEAFEISNMNPDTPLQQGNLPGVYGRCFVNHETDGEILFKEIETQLDTVWFFPKDNIGVLIHRGSMEVNEDDGTDILQILIAHENINDPPRGIQHYQEELTKRMDPEEGFKYMMYTAPLIPEGCRCGFDILKEEGDFPLEQLGLKNTQAFSKQKEKDAYEQLEKQKTEIKKQMEGSDPEKSGVDINSIFESIHQADPQVEAPEAKKMKELMENIAPGISENPENIDITKLNLKGFDDLKKYTDELTAEKQKEAEEKINEELLRLKGLGDSPEATEAVAKVEKAIAEMKQPPILPRFYSEDSLQRVREQFAEAQKQMVLMRSMGVSEEQFAQFNSFDFDDIEKQVKEGLEKAKDSYRIGAHYIGEARSPHEGKEPEIAAALVKAYQEGGKTAGGDYAFTDLSGLDLSGIDLSGAYLEYVNLTDANLTDADLSNAILAHADLTRTDFTRAKLTGANVGAATMKNTRFVDADLTGAILGKAKIEEAVFHRCKLVDRMEMFLDTSFQKVDFSGSDLKKNNFIDSDISGCIFAGADLSESNFINPKMDNTDFNGSILKSVNFIKAEAENAVFRQAEMKNARFVGGCILPGADFSGADAGEANLRDCELQNADFTDAFLHKADFGGSDLTGAKFVRANAVQAQFNKSNLVYADLYRIHLMEGSLYKARLSAARFTEANLYSVNFMGSIVGEEGMDDADFTDAYR